jgi:hypothetical protein
MISLTFLIGALGLLFVMAYATSRRFGMLGLALAAGALLSTNWTGNVTPFIQQQGIQLVTPPLELVVRVALILIPPALLLLSGPVYTVRWQRILGALAFALFGFALLSGPLGLILQLDEPGLSFYNFMNKYQSLFIVLGVIAAIADALLTGHTKGKKREH